MPKVTLQDIALKEVELSPTVRKLREAYFDAMPEVCVERPKLVTEAYRELDLFGKERIGVLDKARVYAYVLERKHPIVWHRSARNYERKAFEIEAHGLLAGSTTTKFKGVPIYPELFGLALWPELETISKRPANPYFLTAKDADILNEEVFPAWLDDTILEQGKMRFGSQADFRLFEKLVFFLASKPTGISHTIPDFSRAVNMGMRRMIDRARQKADDADDRNAWEFYRAVETALEGIISYSHRIAAKAEKLAESESDEQVKKELVEIARIHRRVPEFPASTFREGVTTVWMCWVAAHLENANIGLSLGRLDQLLYPLYEKDLELGRIDPQSAVDLLSMLWLKIGDHVPMVPKAGEQLFGGSGSNQAITIGGVDEEGKDAVNDLTYIMLRAIELMLLRDPNLNARYHIGVNSSEYLRRLCQVNISTRATPAIHNDLAVFESLTSKGDTLEQARDYGVVGCVEPCSQGRHYGHSGALLVNLTSALEMALFDGRHRHTGLDEQVGPATGRLDSFSSFEDFFGAFRRQVEWLADKAVGVNNALGRVHQALYATPILSALFKGPLDKGKDLIEGGAEINSSGATMIGFADVVDSLTAIEHHVFGMGTVTASQLLEALENDFADHEDLAVLLANPDKTPKYGNEHPIAQKNAVAVVEMLDEIFSSRENYRGGTYRVGYWTMTNHAGLGRLVGALPNGRRAGENFASGITPVSGETPGLTAVLNSVASLPRSALANGVALNIKYTPPKGGVPDLDDELVERFAQTVEAYFKPAADAVGGMEVQFNVTDHETFLDALNDPVKYRELLVRVSGYTAYFKDLNPQMQKEIIERTEYELATGHAVTHPPFEIPGLWRKP